MTDDSVILKKAGVFVMTAGAVLLLSALLLLCHNRSESVRAGQQAERLLEGIEAYLADAPAAQTVSAPADDPSDENASKEGGDTGPFASASSDRPQPYDPEMPTVILDGYGFVGHLEIPALALELPILSEWSYDRLKIAPCRQFGSSRTDDLVIAAHNYRSHFGRLRELAAGDAVFFTDMDGLSSAYSVEDIRVVQPTEIACVRDSGFALVLYTCTYGGESRVAVFCSRAGAESGSPCL